MGDILETGKAVEYQISHEELNDFFLLLFSKGSYCLLSLGFLGGCGTGSGWTCSGSGGGTVWELKVKVGT